MPTVLFSAPYLVPLQKPLQPLLAHYDLDALFTKVQERLSEAEIFTYAGQFDGTICGDDSYTARVLEACVPRLKVISKWGTGIDSIDSRAAARLGIQVFRTPNAFTLPVADSALGYILAFVRQQPWMDRAMKAGRWEKIAGRSLSECTLGVIGVGNIGKAIIHRARGFGVKILGNDIIEINQDFVTDYGVEMTSLEDLLARSDFVSLNCDLNPTSFHLINERSLGYMKPTAVLINVARGPVVDEQAMVAALERGRIAGAALDVFEIEPLPPDSPLTKMDNVILAPHNANSSPKAWKHVHFNTIRNLLTGLELEVGDEFQILMSQVISNQA